MLIRFRDFEQLLSHPLLRPQLSSYSFLTTWLRNFGEIARRTDGTVIKEEKRGREEEKRGGEYDTKGKGNEGTG